MACRSLEAPLALLTEIDLPCPASVDEPHPLAQGLAEGRFPGLESVLCWRFLDHPTNAQLCQQALMALRLPRLRELFLCTGPGFDAWRRCMLDQPADVMRRQAPMKELSIEDDGDLDGAQGLDAMLRLPCFARLESIYSYMGREDTEAHMLGVVARYIQHTGGAPCLRTLELDASTSTTDGLGPLVRALGSGAPNLDYFSLPYVDSHKFEDLGAIYAAGGLARLRELVLKYAEVTEEGLAAFLRGVGFSPHQGAALEKLVVNQYPLDAEE